MSHASKRARSTKVIGTHNGTFHCDEALAVFLLRQTSEYKDADLVRTRDPALLEPCSIVVDVGGEYSPATHRYDHHQRGFEEVFGHGYKTKLSSAGLVYKHFGREIVASRIGEVDQGGEGKVQLLWLKMYKAFIEAIDAIDNGISQFSSEIKPAYQINTNLSTRVGWLNPAWNQPFDIASVDAAFEKASSLAGGEFLNRLDYYANAWLPGRDIVVQALQNRQSTDPSGKIVHFEVFAPWKEHLFDLENELKIDEDAKPVYVIYADETGGNYRIQAVPVSVDSFASRKALPKNWCGLRDDALSKESGIEGCIFAHASGFIGGNKTKEGALEMAKKALAL